MKTARLANTFLKRLFKSLGVSVAAALLLFISLQVLFDVTSDLRLIKKSIAMSTLVCLREELVTPDFKCEKLIEKIRLDVAALNFEIWVLNDHDELIWQYPTTSPIPYLEHQFGRNNGQYIVFEPAEKWLPNLPAPSGFIDDISLKRRVIIGDPLFSNEILQIRNKALVSLGILFLLGIVISSLLSIRVLNRKAKESEIILAKIKNGDYTARFKTESWNEVSDLSRSFNKMVDVLTESLTKIQRQESSRKRLIAELSHDLKTPLTSVKSFLQILESESITPNDRQECLHALQSENQYMTKLVNSLFELSLLEDPSTANHFKQISIDDFLMDLMRSHQLELQNRNIQLRIHDIQTQSWLAADEILLRRMILNILHNAHRFAKTEISFSCFFASNKVIIEISDDGEGFSESAQRNFKRTSTGRSINSDSGEIHAGLGTLISARIAELFGGSLEMKRLENRTIMRFEFTPHSKF